MVRGAWWAALLSLAGLASAGAAPPWPAEDAVAQVWGVNLRLAPPLPGELEMLALAGVRWGRVELSWAATEPKAGEYDFTEAVGFADALVAHGIRPWFVLGYQHPVHAPYRGTAEPAGRAAFARWAAAAGSALRGRGAVWEIWNEPNNPRFWEPKPDPIAYLTLALAATRALRAADPAAIVVGPAVTRVDVNFLRLCGAAGLFELWDGVTVHPYRRGAPETALEELRAARAVIRGLTPAGRAPPPLLVSEWGYSTTWLNEELQAACVARVWLASAAAGIPAVLWYEWRESGDEPQNPEHHFGLVRRAYRAGQNPVFAPKPAYTAAATIARELRYYRLNKALTHDAGRARLLLFERAYDAPPDLPRYKLALWTTAASGMELVNLPIGPGTFKRVDTLGRPLGDLTVGGPALGLQADGVPQFLVPAEPSPRLQVLAAWPRWPAEFAAAPGTALAASATWSNPLDVPVRLTPALDPPPATPPPGMDFILGPRQTITLTSAPLAAPSAEAPQRLRTGIEGWWQESWLVAARPPALELTPLNAQELTVSAPEVAGGQLAVRAGGLEFSARPAPGVAPSVAVPAAALLARPDSFLSAAVADAAGGELAAQVFGRVERLRLPAGRPGSPSGLRAVPEGGRPGGGEASSAWAEPPDGSGAPAPVVLRVDFNLARGGRYFRFVPGVPAPLPQWPRRVGFWVYGDDTPVQFSLRVRDVSGQMFQPLPVVVQGRRWQPVWLELDPALCRHWDGQGDGVPRGPFVWDCYLMIERSDEEPARGALYLAPPTLVFARE